jgi:hypothetical protein
MGGSGRPLAVLTLNSRSQWVLRLCLRLRAALLYVGFHCLSLHVSAYMAIFRCVGVFIYVFKQSASLFLVSSFLNNRSQPV